MEQKYQISIGKAYGIKSKFTLKIVLFLKVMYFRYDTENVITKFVQTLMNKNIELQELTVLYENDTLNSLLVQNKDGNNHYETRFLIKAESKLTNRGTQLNHLEF